MVRRPRRRGSLYRWTGQTLGVPLRRFPLLPRSLLARTFLLLAALLTASVLAWSGIYAWLEQIPRAQQAAQIIISVINLTRASLVSADPQRRLELLTELSMREGLRIYPDGDIPDFEPIEGDRALVPIEQELRKRLDPRRYNGAVFLGLNGVAVKSHGGTDALGFAHAVGVAVDMIKHGIIEKIRSDYARMTPPNPATPESRAAAV